LIFYLGRNPYKRGHITSNTYYDWLLVHAFLLVPAQAYVGKFLATFKEYPPRQKVASFSLDQVMETSGRGRVPLVSVAQKASSIHLLGEALFCAVSKKYSCHEILLWH